MRRVLPPGTTLIYTNPGEAFSLYVTIASIAGTLLAGPFIMFQIWRFIAPGLYANHNIKPNGFAYRSSPIRGCGYPSGSDE